jgi:Flp pilus assembly pilin Flp
LQICIRQMRSDEAGAAGYEYTQIFAPLCLINFRDPGSSKLMA